MDTGGCGTLLSFILSFRWAYVKSAWYKATRWKAEMQNLGLGDVMQFLKPEPYQEYEKRP